MKLNVKSQVPQATYEGARSPRTNAETQLRRAVLSCMLWEDQFYESGVSMADRIVQLVPQVDPSLCMATAIDARQRFKLRHVPLLIASAMAKLPDHKTLVAHTLEQIIDRPDELTEFIAVHAKLNDTTPDKIKPKLSRQIKIGLGAAFAKFSEYQLAKYDRDGPVQLRDVLHLVHAKPSDAAPGRYNREDRKAKVRRVLSAKERLYQRVIDGKLASPETWENKLSAGGDKAAVFTQLMLDKQLGALAFLRNLRNMQEVNVDSELIKLYGSEVNVERVLPFRFISAAHYAPQLEPMLEDMMLRAVQTLPVMRGPTAVLIDHSGSMEEPVSAKSEITRFDAAAALAMVARERCEDARVFTFSDRCIEVPPRRGFALRDAIKQVINPVGTLLGHAVRHVYRVFPQCQRLIVITDEQSSDRPPQPQGTGYIINVGGYQQGIGYGDWITISGWSEAVLDFIREYESEEA